MVHLAVLSGSLATIQLLLECNNTLINKQAKDGSTALHLAMQQHKKEDCVQTLLFFYPDMTLMNYLNETPLYCAAKAHAWNLFLLLCKNGADLTNCSHASMSDAGDSWLVMAYRDRHVNAIQWLLDHKADWNDVDRKVLIRSLSY